MLRGTCSSSLGQTGLLSCPIPFDLRLSILIQRHGRRRMIALQSKITKWRSHRPKCDAVHTITDKALCAKYVIIALATDLPTKLMERYSAPVTKIALVNGNDTTLHKEQAAL